MEAVAGERVFMRDSERNERQVQSVPGAAETAEGPVGEAPFARVLQYATPAIGRPTGATVVGVLAIVFGIIGFLVNLIITALAIEIMTPMGFSSEARGELACRFAAGAGGMGWMLFQIMRGGGLLRRSNGSRRRMMAFAIGFAAWTLVQIMVAAFYIIPHQIAVIKSFDRLTLPEGYVAAQYLKTLGLLAVPLVWAAVIAWVISRPGVRRAYGDELIEP